VACDQELGLLMNSKYINGNPGHPPNSEFVNFATWTVVTLAGYGVGVAVFIGIGGLALGVPTRELLVPFAVLFSTGFVFSPSLYWSYLARERPRSSAIRLGIGMFFFFQVLMIALLLSSIRLGILSLGEALNEYYPFWVPFSALVSIALFVGRRKMLEAAKAGRSKDEASTKSEAGNDEGSSGLRSRMRAAMTGESIKGGHEITPGSRPVNLAVLMGRIMVGQAVFAASVVGFAGLALGLPVHRLLVPFLLLLYCGLVLSPFVYSARLARERPKSCALRFGIAIFSYLTVSAMALTFGAIKAGVLSPAKAMHTYLPFVLPISVFGGVITYFVGRKVLGASKTGRSNSDTSTRSEAGNDEGSNR